MNSTISKTTLNPSPPHPSTLFPELTQCKTMRDLNQVHAKLIKTGRINDPLAAAEVLRISAVSAPPHRDLAYARLVFRHMDPPPNCFSFNTLIRALSDDDPLDALILFDEMLHCESVGPNRFTFPSVLKACARAGRVEEGKQVHGLVVKYGLGCDAFVVSNLVRMYVMCSVMSDACAVFRLSVGMENVVLWNVMVDGYVRIGDFKAARQVFNEMPQRSLVSWNSMISGYAQNGLFKEAIELFREMQIVGVSPNYVTLVSVLPAISRLGALELGKWVHLHAEKNKIEIDAVLGSALIDMYSKCGNIEKALQVFETLPQRNVIAWNAIISGLAMHGQAKDAIDHFWRMEQAGVTPNDVTYIAVLSACSHAGLVHEGRLIFDHMVRLVGLEPRIEHFGCMVDLLGRAGHLEEAEKLILEMPITPDDVILKALLGACKTHKNIQMGKRIARLLMEMSPRDSGAYVALSNMYASLGNWEAVAGVRLMMKEGDIRKDPGCSWIMLNGVIHEFLVEDNSHPRAKEINLMLEEMCRQLSLCGYTPDTSQVFLNVEDEEKGSALHYHSEKIAIAFGLISTAPQTPLLVVKNLRICDDCHSSIKLISKIYNRKITVRDRKRFHHFVNGSCSCMDHW
ncbi:pentatricopeptide repeat-containing protein At5g48910 [Actinidia eriantha]|uniref:pentatricopeptide repeat-containing protein At5g48910 n=1 Tax=Actinidia eriantha TaxID=165200 RepID=UPI002587CE52|nr:pentatricopeptide repeat-containing protein At5g48910 [Actinidia eriantha]